MPAFDVDREDRPRVGATREQLVFMIERHIQCRAVRLVDDVGQPDDEYSEPDGMYTFLAAGSPDLPAFHKKLQKAAEGLAKIIVVCSYLRSTIDDPGHFCFLMRTSPGVIEILYEYEVLPLVAIDPVLALTEGIVPDWCP